MLWQCLMALRECRTGEGGIAIGKPRASDTMAAGKVAIVPVDFYGDESSPETRPGPLPAGARMDGACQPFPDRNGAHRTLGIRSGPLCKQGRGQMQAMPARCRQMTLAGSQSAPGMPERHLRRGHAKSVMTAMAVNIRQYGRECFSCQIDATFFDISNQLKCAPFILFISAWQGIIG